MIFVYDKAIVIQSINEDTEEWSDLFKVHARINKTKADSEYLQSGSVRAKRSLTFEVRYFKKLEQISLNTQLYRIVYNGVPYNITDYDDYMMRHRTIKFVGESYGE